MGRHENTLISFDTRGRDVLEGVQSKFVLPRRGIVSFVFGDRDVGESWGYSDLHVREAR